MWMNNATTYFMPAHNPGGRTSSRDVMCCVIFKNISRPPNGYGRKSTKGLNKYASHTLITMV